MSLYSVDMLNVIRLIITKIVFKLIVVITSIFIVNDYYSVTILSVIMLNVILLSVVAPLWANFGSYLYPNFIIKRCFTIKMKHRRFWENCQNQYCDKTGPTENYQKCIMKIP
jgi:hypothetical protein